MIPIFPDSWENKWVYSEHPGKEFGKFKLTAGKFYNDAEEDKGKPPFYYLYIHVEPVTIR